LHGTWHLEPGTRNPVVIDILLPSDQTEGTTNTVGKWFKSVGDRVELNDPLLEITTDKVTVEIAASAAGVLAEIIKQEGDAVEPGEVLGRISAGAADAIAPGVTGPIAESGQPSTPTADPGATGEAQELSPAVRRLLKEHGLTAASIKGSGKGGRITLEDVEAHLTAAAKPTAARQTVGPSVRRPHSAMRKSIADHMVRSASIAPHVTSVFEADLTAVLAHRQAHQSGGARLTLTAYFSRATVEAIRAVPEANSRWHDDGLELWDEVHLGIATALGTDGLIVPVLRNAHALDLMDTARGIQDLTERARSGGLSPQDVQGGTFTISNHGVSGSLLASPIIINQPQSAILGVGKLQQRPVVIDGAVVPRPMIYVTLTIDHRVLDGFAANAFLTRWVETIEQWKG
jgi:2-oxoglutarate dehydrogenase E2 component (dihydrolipoamide succinyltransferase)